MKPLMKFFLILFLLSFVSVKSASAADVQVEATVDRNKVEIGSAVLLNITVYGTQKADPVELPSIDGFQSKASGTSSSFSFNNGQVSNSMAYRFYLVPTKEGRFKIPPVTVTADSQSYTTQEIPIEVVAQGAAPSAPSSSIQQQQQPAAAPLTQSLEDKIFLIAETPKKKAYVGEKIPLTVKLYVRNINARDIQLPALEHNGFTIDEYEKPKQYQQALGGVVYNVVEFNTSAYPTQAGPLTLGPAQLTCNVLYKTSRQRPPGFENFDQFFNDDMMDNFFGGYESFPYTIKSASLTTDVAAQPQANIPPDFSGAIGQFDFKAAASPSEVREGDPITLKMQVTGAGNLKGIALPVLKENGDFKIYDPQVREENGAKIVDQVLIPKSVSVKKVPAISFSYFDPADGQYKTIVQGPFDITVKKAEGDNLKIVDHAAASKLVIAETYGKDIIFLKDYPGTFRHRGDYLLKNIGLYIVVVIYPFIILAAAVVHARNRRLKTDVRYARKLRAPQKAKDGLKAAHRMLSDGNQKEFYDTIFTTLQEYFQDKLHLPPGVVTVHTLEEKFKTERLNVQNLAEVKTIFDECDTVRYAAVSYDKSKMTVMLKKTEEIIDALERWKK